MKKGVLAILLLIGLVVYAGYDYYMKSSSKSEETLELGDTDLEQGIEKGQLAPNFSLLDLQGNPVELQDFRGKKVMVNFWATWCPPCRWEMPHMQKFYEDYEAKDVVILGINLTPTEAKEDQISAFVEEQKLTFPIVLDQEGEVMQTYEVMAYPTTFVLDTRGVIQEIFQGAINYEIMEETISKINE